MISFDELFHHDDAHTQSTRIVTIQSIIDNMPAQNGVVFHDRSPEVDVGSPLSAQGRDNRLRLKTMELVRSDEHPVISIEGASGTGKTSILAAVIRECLKENKKALVLLPDKSSLEALKLKLFKGFGWNTEIVSAPSEGLWDDDKLVPYNDKETIKDHETLELLVNKSREKYCNGEMSREELDASTLGAISDFCKNRYQKHEEILEKAIVHLSTIDSPLLYAIAQSKVFQPNTLLIDDASQFLPQHPIPSRFRFGKIVMAGAKEMFFRPSYVNKKQQQESLLDAVKKQKKTHILFKCQHRGLEKIFEWSSETFHNGELQTGGLECGAVHHHRKRLECRDGPVHAKILLPSVILDTTLESNSGLEWYRLNQPTVGSQNCVNYGELNIVLEHYTRLLNNCFPTRRPYGTVVIIASTAAQVKLIDDAVQETEVFKKYRFMYKTKVCLIDDIQGHEFDVVIFSLVFDNALRYIGDLKDTRRLNYIMARAKLHFVFVGSAYMLDDDATYRSLLEYWDRNKLRFHPSNAKNMAVNTEIDYNGRISVVFGRNRESHHMCCLEYLKECMTVREFSQQEVEQLCDGFPLQKAHDKENSGWTQNYTMKLRGKGGRYPGQLVFEIMSQDLSYIELDALMAKPIRIHKISTNGGNASKEVDDKQDEPHYGICFPDADRSRVVVFLNNPVNAEVYDFESLYLFEADAGYEYETDHKLNSETVLFFKAFETPGRWSRSDNSNEIRFDLLEHRVFDTERSFIVRGEQNVGKTYALAFLIAGMLNSAKLSEKSAIAIGFNTFSMGELARLTFDLGKGGNILGRMTEKRLFAVIDNRGQAEVIMDIVQHWRQMNTEGLLDYPTLHSRTTDLVSNFYKIIAKRLDHVMQKTRILFCTLNSPFIKMFANNEKFNPDVCIIDDASHIGLEQDWPAQYESKKMVVAGNYSLFLANTHLSPFRRKSNLMESVLDHWYDRDREKRGFRGITLKINRYRSERVLSQTYTGPIPSLHHDICMKACVYIDTAMEVEESRRKCYEKYVAINENNFSYVNEGEADLVVLHVKHLLNNHRIKAKDIAVITNTEAQIRRIRQLLDHHVSDDDSPNYLNWVTVRRLEDFLAQKILIVIYSPVRDNPIRDGAYDSWVRWLYLKTRASNHCAYIGSSEMYTEPKIKDVIRRSSASPNILRGGQPGSLQSGTWNERERLVELISCRGSGVHDEQMMAWCRDRLEEMGPED